MWTTSAMQPITMMRNALGAEYGGTGVPLVTPSTESVDFGSRNANQNAENPGIKRGSFWGFGLFHADRDDDDDQPDGYTVRPRRQSTLFKKK